MFAAAKEAAASNPSQNGTIALLLEIAKAYETLQRPFLLSVLKWLGFSLRFLSVVAALHDNTTCQFIVSSYRLPKLQ